MSPSLAFFIIAFFIYVIAIGSIGKECYDKHPDFKKNEPTNDTFLSYFSIAPSVVGLVGFIGYLAFTTYISKRKMAVGMMQDE